MIVYISMVIDSTEPPTTNEETRNEDSKHRNYTKKRSSDP
jgi:hypothetical protein